ncbi:MAG: hypothetical protein PHY41_01900 [Candidatus Cloacimonetes bacterium]|jgi:hypothetical protein|nr:hypothetical protein [Candidatus Cloacimonadota bacterium]MDD3282222.1 hypothetical protein [Candidatus Cloacimonadota bacterium]MDD4231931.1 hypothetical protein [Candidatus Cloacimonadota bacterium]MDY0298500.1 hypothetical protein [Candidatus Cloacimonadaceae bacterium]
MGVILDIIGAFVIGGMLLLMVISFQFQMQEAADRALYTQQMVDHMDQCATKLNSVVALAGVGFDPEDAIVHATPDSLVFWTYWDYQQNQLGVTPVKLSIKLSNAPDPYGIAVLLAQDGVPLNDLGYLFWIDELKFRYYTKNDALTTSASSARSAEIRMGFYHDPPRAGSQSIRTKLQFKCYFMNAYMRGA